MISEDDDQKLLTSEREEAAEVDSKVERDYSCALDNEFAEFYFLHSPGGSNKRTDLLIACIKKNDYNRAIALVDMIASTHNNDGDNDLNGWGRQNMLTMMYLIHEFDYAKRDNFREEGITDEMRQVVKQLVDRIWKYLPSKSQLELSGELYRIAPEEDDFDKYIKQLLEDVDIYCSLSKTRRKGKDINFISQEIFASFERLSQNKRLDVIEQILLKFSSVRERLKPVTYNSWMSGMVRSLEDNDVLSIYQVRPELFEIWLESKSVRKFDIYQAAQKIGNVCSRNVFMAFRNMVFSRIGFIEGFDYAFKATSENTKTKLLHEGNAVKIELDYLDVTFLTSISSISIYLLIDKKIPELSSVRVSFCKINNIEADNLGFLTKFDNGKPSMGWNIYGKHSRKELTVYSDFFEANDIHHIYKIEFQLAMMDSKGELIELTSPITLEYESSSGEYKTVHENVGLIQ